MSPRCEAIAVDDHEDDTQAERPARRQAQRRAGAGREPGDHRPPAPAPAITIGFELTRAANASDAEVGGRRERAPVAERPGPVRVGEDGPHAGPRGLERQRHHCVTEDGDRVMVREVDRIEPLRGANDAGGLAPM